MKAVHYALLLFALSWAARLPAAAESDPRQGRDKASDTIHWPEFLSRQDPVWETLPLDFDRGAFLGNGLLGTMIYRDGDNRLRFEMGRSDVTEHRRDNGRLPIGGMAADHRRQDPGGQSSSRSLECRGARLGHDHAGELDVSRLHPYRSDGHCSSDLETSDGEQGAAFTWDPRVAQDARNATRFKDPPNPPSRQETVAGVSICVQSALCGRRVRHRLERTPACKGAPPDREHRRHIPGHHRPRGGRPDRQRGRRRGLQLNAQHPPRLVGTPSTPKVSSPFPTPDWRAFIGSSSTSWPAPRGPTIRPSICWGPGIATPVGRASGGT